MSVKGGEGAWTGGERLPLIEELVWNGSSGNNLVDMEALTRIFLRGEGGGDGQTTLPGGFGVRNLKGDSNNKLVSLKLGQDRLVVERMFQSTLQHCVQRGLINARTSKSCLCSWTHVRF